MLKSQLNASNRIDAINSLAVPVVTYSMNIINWKMEELKKLDRKTTKLLTMERMRHLRADVDRLYLPRTAGGRGLVQTETTYKTSAVGLYTYLYNKDDHVLKIGRDYDLSKKTLSVHHEAAKFKRELNPPETDIVESEPTTSYVWRVKVMAKHQALEQVKNKVGEHYPKRTSDNDVDQVQTHKWLSTTGPKSETEGFIIAAQHQCIKTNYYRNKVLKDGSSRMCRICNQYQGTEDHLVSGCLELAKAEYIQRQQRISTGQSVSTMTSKCKTNSTNASSQQLPKYSGICRFKLK